MGKQKNWEKVTVASWCCRRTSKVQFWRRIFWNRYLCMNSGSGVSGFDIFMVHIVRVQKAGFGRGKFPKFDPRKYDNVFRCIHQYQSAISWAHDVDGQKVGCNYFLTPPATFCAAPAWCAALPLTTRGWRPTKCRFGAGTCGPKFWCKRVESN